MLDFARKTGSERSGFLVTAIFLYSREVFNAILNWLGLDECKGVCRVLVTSTVESNVFPYSPGALPKPQNLNPATCGRIAFGFMP